MKKDFYLTRYALIIKRLESSPATYSQLEDYLLNSFEFQDAEIKSYSIRTLQRDIREISDLFNLSIHNKKKEITDIILRAARSWKWMNTTRNYWNLFR
jgi:hypothetical protein